MSRLAARAYMPGDELPDVGAFALVAGANTDIESDQDRAYSMVLVIGYTPCGGFACFQRPGHWPFVERLTNCWFAPIGAANTQALASGKAEVAPEVVQPIREAHKHPLNPSKESDMDAQEQRLAEYLDGYEFRADEGDYQPNERERALIEAEEDTSDA